jgi:hypothetical protein
MSGYNADEIGGWIGAIRQLESALIDAEVKESKDYPDEDHWFVFEHMLEVIGVDQAALPAGWEDEGLWEYDQDDRHLVVDLGELFATFPVLFTSSHPAVVTYKKTLDGLEIDRQTREILEDMPC